jgi:hypothetical protein
MKRLLLAVVTMLSLHSCTDEKAMSEKEKKEISDEIIKTLHDYFEDISKSGLTAELKYLDNSPDFFWVPPGYGGPINYDSVVHILNRTAPTFKAVNNSFVALTVFPLTEKYATYTATIQSHVSDTMGMKSNYSLLETGVMIKRAGGWKLLNGQTSILNR